VEPDARGPRHAPSAADVKGSRSARGGGGGGAGGERARETGGPLQKPKAEGEAGSRRGRGPAPGPRSCQAHGRAARRSRPAARAVRRRCRAPASPAAAFVSRRCAAPGTGLQQSACASAAPHLCCQVGGGAAGAAHAHGARGCRPQSTAEVSMRAGMRGPGRAGRDGHPGMEQLVRALFGPGHGARLAACARHASAPARAPVRRRRRSSPQRRPAGRCRMRRAPPRPPALGRARA